MVTQDKAAEPQAQSVDKSPAEQYLEVCAKIGERVSLIHCLHAEVEVLSKTAVQLKLQIDGVLPAQA